LRFAPAQVVRIGTTEPPPGPTGMRTDSREFRAGDTVKPTDVLAEIFSVDVGSKKNDLFEAIVQLRLDEIILAEAEKYSGSVPPVFLWTAQRNVETDHSAVRRAEYTLVTWEIPRADIDAVIKEARAVLLTGGKRPREDDATVQQRQLRWATVLLKPPLEGVLIERNTAEKEVVTDNTQNLFVIARVSSLTVTANAPEDLLPELDRLQGGARVWTLQTVGLPARGLTVPIDDISYLVDPNQHSLVLKSQIKNPGDRLRAGQYVTAKVQLPPPEGVVEVPVAAVVDDGKQSVVFVQVDPKQPDQFTLRRVQVTQRYDQVVYVRSTPFPAGEERTPEEVAEGLLPREPLREGERVLLSGVLELKKELEDREAATTGR
jgi:cobalt-zinc-cadmium efflux system membrane fusion protein